MPSARYRHHGCRIMDDLSYKGMRTLILENELLRVGILLDKGADIFQFLHKPSDTDFLWRSPAGLRDPVRYRPTGSSSLGSFMDTYHGGWQEILPGGGPANYRGAELGLHGEAALLGWDCDILEDEPERIAVRLTVDCIRTPFRLERIMRLESGKPVLFFEETLSNLSSEPQEFMWGHHPALGAPFLHQGLKVFVPAGKVEVQSPLFLPTSSLEPGATYNWPVVPSPNGPLDMSVIPGPEAGYAELLYLQQLQDGWYAVCDQSREVGFGLAWPKEVFPYLWFWMVYGKAPGYPWWDQVYVIALEPWTSIPDKLDRAILRKTQCRLAGQGKINLKFSAVAISGQKSVSKITLDGTVS